MKKKTIVTIDELAQMIARSFVSQQKYMDDRFASIDKRFDVVDRRFDESDARHRQTHARLDILERDVSIIKDGHHRLFHQVQRIDDNQAKLIDEVKKIRQIFSKMVTREEYEALSHRLLKVEKHLGLV